MKELEQKRQKEEQKRLAKQAKDMEKMEKDRIKSEKNRDAKLNSSKGILYEKSNVRKYG